MTRIPRRLALAGLAVLLLTGCGGQLRPGAAAVVGEQRITTESLQQVVERGLSDPQAAEQFGADRPGYQRQALSRLINRALLQEAAVASGVTVTERQVSDQVDRFVAQVGSREELDQQAAQSGISREDLLPFVRDIVLNEQLGEKITEGVQVTDEQLQAVYDENLAQYDQVQSRHILVADEQMARTLLDQVRQDPSRFAALAAEFSIDPSNKDQGGDLGLAGRGQFVPEFEQVLFATPPGTFGIAKTDFGWHVIGVVERQTTTLEQAAPELRRTALQEQRQAATAALLQETSERLGIRVNPRFGRWNGELGGVEPIKSPNGVLTPAPDAPEPGTDPLRPGAGAPDGQAPDPRAPQPQAPPTSAPSPATR